jgi:hypothetical protein
MSDQLPLVRPPRLRPGDTIGMPAGSRASRSASSAASQSCGVLASRSELAPTPFRTSRPMTSVWRTFTRCSQTTAGGRLCSRLLLGPPF